MKFKIGDRVQCNIDGSHFITGERNLVKGRMYTVANIGSDSIRVDGSLEWWGNARFSVAPREITDFED